MLKQDAIEIRGKSIPSAGVRLNTIITNTENDGLREQLSHARNLLNEQLVAGGPRQAVHLKIDGGSLTCRIGKKEVTTRITGAEEYIDEHIRTEGPDGTVTETRRKIARGREVKVEQYQSDDPTEFYRQDPTIYYAGMSMGSDIPYQQDPNKLCTQGTCVFNDQPLIVKVLAWLTNNPGMGMNTPLLSPSIDHPRIKDSQRFGLTALFDHSRNTPTRSEVDRLIAAGKILCYGPEIDYPLKKNKRKSRRELFERATRQRAVNWGLEQSENGRWVSKKR